MYWLAVSRKFSGKGFSKEMVNFASNYAREKGFEMLRLDTNANEEKLVLLYKSLGFTVMGVDGESTAYFQKNLK